MKNEFVLFSISLVLIVVIAVAGVAKVYQKTFDAIMLQKETKVTETLGDVLPLANQFEVRHFSAGADSYWVGRDAGGQITGLAFLGSARGYSSDIVCMTGLDLNGKIIRMRILSQRETPGLGTRVEEQSSQATLWNPNKGKGTEGPPWFQLQFSGLSAIQAIGIRKEMEWHKMTDQQKAELAAQNSVSAMTGATVSTLTVTQAIEGKAKLILDDNARLVVPAAHDSSAAKPDSAAVKKEI